MSFYQGKKVLITGASAGIGYALAEELAQLDFSTLEDWQIISDLSNYQSIITIASPEAQNFIKSFFKKKNKVELTDYFFFC